MAKRKRTKRRDNGKPGVARWRAGLLAGLGISAFIVLALAGALLFFSRDDQTADPVARQQAVDAAIAALPVEPRVGARAPDFTLNDINGNQISLSDFQGKPVVITFFHTW